MFNKEITAAIQKHALECFPQESCGIVSGNVYLPMNNAHRNPMEGFDCTKEAAPYVKKGEVQAVVHSHPSGAQYFPHDAPSQADMASQQTMGVPYGIVATDGTVVASPWYWGPGVALPPLEGRDFRHGPSGTDGKGDCYALIKDYYEMHMDIKLPEVPRGDNWWNSGRDLYMDHFEKFGFKTVGIDDIQVGDIFLTKIISPVINHGGILCDPGRILHHLGGRLSKVESAHNYIRRSMWIRHASRFKQN